MKDLIKNLLRESLSNKFNHPDYDDKKLKKSIVNIINETNLWSMATINKDNTSHINTAYFCYDNDFNFYFLTSPSAKHSLNLLDNNSMAITIFNTNQSWNNLKQGIQIFGTTQITNNSNKKIAYNEYCKRFSDYSNWITGLTKKEKNNLDTKFYCFTPNSLKLFDEKNFGVETFIEIKL